MAIKMTFENIDRPSEVLKYIDDEVDAKEVR